MNTMVFTKLARCASIVSVGLLGLSAAVNAQTTQHYTQTNLVSDMPGVAATTDPNLVNPWGLSRGSTSPWWVSDNGMGVSTLYSGTGSIVPLVVTIPGGVSGVTGTPSGQVFNGTTDFNLVAGQPAKFLFVTEDGTVSGWNPNVNPSSAVIKWNSKGAGVFKGVAMAEVGDPQHKPVNRLYVADFRQGRILVLDGSFHRVNLSADAFMDPNLPAGFAPFNIQNIGGRLYVAFAMQGADKLDEVDGAGLGYVDVFSADGVLEQRLEHTTYLNAPWGITQAPGDFGVFSHNILVGQFGSGNILAFDAATGHFRGRLTAKNNSVIAIDGLWGLEFGNDSSAGNATALYFSAGPDSEAHGLFGTLTPIENALGGDQ